ncbi:MAG: Lrp/AsnC family transcriptional regulator [Clostridiaceae bacterium]
MLDETDLKILSILSKNSRFQWREIGESVHLTGQAVANRIRKMEELGVIEGYTVKLNPSKLGENLTAFITVFMKTIDHVAFQNFIKDSESICEAHRISGDGCYLLKSRVNSDKELNLLLDEILKYGNYRLNLSIGNIK